MYRNILLCCTFASILLPLCLMSDRIGQAGPPDAADNKCCICWCPTNQYEMVNTRLVFGCDHSMHDQCLALWVRALIGAKSGASVRDIRCPFCRLPIQLPLDREIQGVVREAVLNPVACELAAALVRSEFELAQQLVTNGVNMSQADADFVLRQALRFGNCDSVRWAVSHGAHIENWHIQAATERGDCDIAQYLYSRNNWKTRLASLVRPRYIVAFGVALGIILIAAQQIKKALRSRHKDT